MQFMLQFTHVLDILEFEEENKTKKCFGNFFLQICCLRNSLEELILSPESTNDCGRFHCFQDLF